MINYGHQIHVEVQNWLVAPNRLNGVVDSDGALQVVAGGFV